MFLWPVRLALRIVSLLLAVLVVYVGVTFIQVWLTSMQDDPHHADAAIVFGTEAGYDQPGADLRGRLDRALELFEAGDVPLVVVTGGKLPGDHLTEAMISAQWLEARHVPSRDIVVGGGDDTWQNVGSVATAMLGLHVHTVLVVTDPFHEDRAMAIVSDYGFSPSPAPSRHSPIGGFGLLGHLLQESVEVAAGRIIGYGHLSSVLHG